MDLHIAGSERTPTAVPETVVSQSTSPLQQHPILLSSENSMSYTEKGPSLAMALQIEGPDPDELSTMVGDKDVDALRALGGTTGLLLGLG
ncbi:hypothetical protein GGI16_002517, partial [Coemansia sp. S142-1]